MRQVKSLADVQLALNELYSFKDSLTVRDFNLGGRRVVGAGPGRKAGEYATFEQIPTIETPTTIHKDQFYAIVWERDSTLTTGQLIPPYVFGYGREGIPHQVWVQALTPPSGGPLSINIQYTAIDTQTDLDTDTIILDDDLELSDGQTRRVFSSTFITSVPKFQRLAWVRPLIISANASAFVSIGLVVKRF